MGRGFSSCSTLPSLEGRKTKRIGFVPRSAIWSAPVTPFLLTISLSSGKPALLSVAEWWRRRTTYSTLLGKGGFTPS